MIDLNLELTADAGTACTIFLFILNIIEKQHFNSVLLTLVALVTLLTRLIILYRIIKNKNQRTDV